MPRLAWPPVGQALARENARQWYGIASSADGVKLTAAARSDQLYTSTNSGVTWTARDSVRAWWAVASSSDGSKLAATATGGRIYTSAATTTSNPLAGAAGTTVGLQYIGNNQWQALTEANAASANSVAAANITGTVAGTQIAVGAVGSTQLASGLTLGGVTIGTFNGNLVGNASIALSAASFTGSLIGDVGGTQLGTVVMQVGGTSAASVAAGANVANAATSANTASALVKRDGSGNFSAGTINLGGGITLPTTTSFSVGVIMQNGARLFHSYGSGNFFVGTNSGNFTMTGNFNTAAGSAILQSNTTGSENTGTGFSALYSNTTGSENTANGIVSLFSNTTGTGNAAVGWSALANNTTGFGNIALGRRAGQNLTTGNNNIVIGNEGVAGEANTIRIGTPGTQTDTYLTGVVHGDGSGLTGVGGGLSWVSIAGTTQSAAPRTGYIATSASQTTITLPASPTVGDVVRVTGWGTGGWKIAQNAGQSISTNGSMPSFLEAGRESIRSWSSVASSSDGTKLVAAVFGGQIYTSVDSGATWTARESSRLWNRLASSSDGTELVAVTSSQIYTSTDSGATWTARESNRSWLSVASSSTGTKLVTVVQNGQIYTSTDSGATWTARESNKNWRSVASSSDGTKLVAVVDGGQIYTSIDSGATWAVRESSRPWYSVASSSDGAKLVATARFDQIYTSIDSGVTWTARGKTRDWRSVASSSDGTKLVAVADPGQIYIPSPTSSTTSGSAGSLDGGQFAAIELLYIGGGQFIPLSSAGTIVSF